MSTFSRFKSKNRQKTSIIHEEGSIYGFNKDEGLKGQLREKLKCKILTDKFKTDTHQILDNYNTNHLNDVEIEYIGFTMPERLCKQKINKQLNEEAIRIQKLFRGYISRKKEFDFYNREGNPRPYAKKEKKPESKLNKIKKMNFKQFFKKEEESEGSLPDQPITDENIQQNLDFFYIFKKPEYNDIMKEMFVNEKSVIMKHLNHLEEGKAVKKTIPKPSHLEIKTAKKKSYTTIRDADSTPIKSVSDVG